MTDLTQTPTQPLTTYTPSARTTIRSELNLEKWITALFTTSKFPGKSREVWREIKRGEEVLRLGVIVGRRQHHRKVAELGVLTVPELRVFYALIKVWEDFGKPNAEVSLLFPNFADLVEKKRGGMQYDQILKSLENLNTVPIQWIQSFYQKESATWHTIRDRFMILPSYATYEVDIRGKVSAKAFRFKFHDRIIRNLLANHTKPKNLEAILAFTHELSVLVYSWLDLVMSKRTRLTISTEKLFASQLHLAAVNYHYRAGRKRALEPVVEELQGRSISTGVLTTVRLEPAKEKRDWLLVVQKRPFIKRLKPTANLDEIALELAKAVGDTEWIVKESRRVEQIASKNRGFWFHLAMRAVGSERVRELIREAQADTRMERHAGQIQGTDAQFFVYWLQELARMRGIDLGLKSKEE